MNENQLNRRSAARIPLSSRSGSRLLMKRRNTSNLEQIEFLTKIRKLNDSPPTNIGIKTFPSDIKVLTSTLCAIEKANLKADISILGGVIIDEWSDTCTYLVMKNVTFTAKVMQSLCHGIPIVTPDFFKALLSSNQLQHKLPDVESFEPPLINPSIGVNVSLKVNVERKRLFAGKTFVFMTQGHMHVYETIIKCAMGKCISVAGKIVNLKTLVEPGVIVIDNSVGSTHSHFFMEAMNVLKDFLRSKGSGMVADTDISLAILNCSLEIFCNAKHQFEENSQKSSRLLLTNDACMSHILSYLDEKDKISFVQVSRLRKRLMETEASASKIGKPTNLASMHGDMTVKCSLTDMNFGNYDKIPIEAASVPEIINISSDDEDIPIVQPSNSLNIGDWNIEDADINLLKSNGWLTDGILSFYLQQLNVTYANNNILFVTASIGAALKFSSSSEWNRFLAEDTKSKSLILFTLTNATCSEMAGTHWILIAYSTTEQICRYFDSQYDVMNVHNYGIQSFCEKIVEYMNGKKLHVTAEKCLQQSNDNDCGIHVLLNAQHTADTFVNSNSYNQQPSFTHEDVRLKRIEILTIIVNSRHLQFPQVHRDPSPGPSTPGKSVNDNQNRLPAPPVQSRSFVENQSDQHDNIPLQPRRRHRKRVRNSYKIKYRKPNYDRHCSVKSKSCTRIPAQPPTNHVQIRNLSTSKKTKKKVRKKVLKRNRKKIGRDEELFTIKCGLKSFIRQGVSKDFYQEIEKHVGVISALQIEASFMIYYYFTNLLIANPNLVIDDKPKFRQYFDALKQVNRGDTANQTRKMNRQYFQVRSENGMEQRYDASNKTNAIAAAADLYEVNLANNIADHMYKRVRLFFKTLHRNIPSYETLDYLFNPCSSYSSHPQLITSLRTELNFRGNFHNLASEWWTFIPFTYRLQQWRRDQQLKTFNVFPILTHKRHHVSYDGQSFQQLLRTWNVSSNDYGLFKPREQEFWRKYFNIEKFETIGHTFFGSIKTDGVSVSITMKRKKQASNAGKNGQIKKKLENKEYKTAFGFDPGERLTLAGLSRDLETGKEKNIKFSSASFRYHSGEHRLTQKFHRWTNVTLNRIRSEREMLPDHASPKHDPHVFLNFQLRNFVELQQLMSSKRITKLTFERFICRKKAIDAVAKQLLGHTKRPVGGKKDKVVFIGSVEANPYIKGYVKAPKKAIVKSMSGFADVLFVNEFRSTMLCAKCFQPNTTSTTPHRCQHCSQCGTTWNRDVNGGRNILYLGYHTLLELPMDRGFSRNFSFPKTAKGYLYVSTKPKPNTKRNRRSTARNNF